jgi:uncharacterized caspase-like protein
MSRAKYSGTRLGGTIVSRRRASDSLVVLFAAVGLLACATTATPTLQDEFESTLELAEEGRSSAQARAAFMFMAGRGVGKNKKQAVRWYNEAAKQGDPTAIDALWEINGNKVDDRSSTITIGGAPSPTAERPAPGNIEFGNYYALVIGNARYSHLTPLVTTTNDAMEVSKVLRDDYGFTVTTLLDGSRDAMREALSKYRRLLSEDDNFLVYYAGHGWVDTQTDEAYWMPVDASPDSDVNWISNSTLATTFRGIEARHVLVVADSCFAGTLVRGLTLPRSGRAAYIERLNARKSRTALTSGGVEPVTDSGQNGHSVFANAFLKGLDENSSVVDATTLFGAIRHAVMLEADQTPTYGNIRKAGHDDGDFLFVRVSSPDEEE